MNIFKATLAFMTDSLQPAIIAKGDFVSTIYHSPCGFDMQIFANKICGRLSPRSGGVNAARHNYYCNALNRVFIIIISAICARTLSRAVTNRTTIITHFALRIKTIVFICNYVIINSNA